MIYALYKYLPRKFLSTRMYHLARIENRPLKNLIIWAYCRITGANTDFAAEKNPFRYPSLNAFFTRALADGARPVDPDNDTLVSPVDGRCAMFGDITNGQLYQAKSQRYRLDALLNSQEDARHYQNGKTLTLYLAPDDYHRIHMPCDAVLTHSSFCPGDKHSVALDLLDKIPALFAANERLVCHFESAYGKMALIMVGALNVSSIETVWHGEYRDNGHNHYTHQPPLALRKGQEIGRFNLGSTVILCLENPDIRFTNLKLENGGKIRMGEPLAKLAESSRG